MKATDLRTAREAAILLAVLFKRSGQKRGRLSERTIKLAGDRLRLKGAYFEAVQEHLAQFSLILIDLPNGGFGLWPLSTFTGAPAITFKRVMWDDIVKLRKDPDYILTLADELEVGEAESGENDD